MDKETTTTAPTMTGSTTTARELTAVLDAVDARPDATALRRRTYELLGAREGFTDATPLPLAEKLAAAGVAGGAVREDEGARWIEDQRRRAAEERLFLAVPLFVAAGTAPPAAPQNPAPWPHLASA